MIDNNTNRGGGGQFHPAESRRGRRGPPRTIDQRRIGERPKPAVSQPEDSVEAP